jgi:hypothetical protein
LPDLSPLKRTAPKRAVRTKRGLRSDMGPHPLSARRDDALDRLRERDQAGAKRGYSVPVGLARGGGVPQARSCNRVRALRVLGSHVAPSRYSDDGSSHSAPGVTTSADTGPTSLPLVERTTPGIPQREVGQGFAVVNAALSNQTNGVRAAPHPRFHSKPPAK